MLAYSTSSGCLVRIGVYVVLVHQPFDYGYRMLRSSLADVDPLRGNAVQIVPV